MGKSKRKEQEQIIEDHLRNYKKYKTGIKTMKMQLEHILPNATVNYELVEGSTGTFNIKSSTEKYAIDRVESKKALYLYEEIERYRIITESIEEAMKELTDKQKEFVQYRYFEGLEVPIVCEKITYSTNSIYDLRRKVLDSFLISLRGLLHF